MPDLINHPPHYTQVTIKGMAVECIDVIEALNLPPHLANALKYIWRFRDKNGLQDVRKAGWYCNRYADWQEAKRGGTTCPPPASQNVGKSEEYTTISDTESELD